MLIIEYRRDGISISDFDYPFWMGEVKHRIERKTGNELAVSTETLINAVRVAIAEGKIKPEDVAFKFNGEILHVNEYGALENWPRGFCDANLVLSERILTLAMAKHKFERLQKENGK